MDPDCLQVAASTSTTPPYSTRIATIMQNRKHYSDQVEFDIVCSKVHWSGLEDEEVSDDDEDCVLDEEKQQALLKANKQAFQDLKRHRHWGPFFSRDGGGGVFWLKVSGGLCSKYELGKKVAEGGQAKIYECRGIFPNGSQEDFMLKVFRKGSFVQDLQKEWPQTIFDPFIDTYGKIIKHGILLDDGRFAFVMRKSWGDLRHLIDLKMQENSNQGPPFRFQEEYLIPIMDIASEMGTLHRRDICHKDLKAANILVNGTIADFEGAYVPILGHGQTMISDYESSVGVLGTTFWRAPEILLATKNWLWARRNGNAPPQISFSKAADVYSFGMVVYEISTGLLPFELEGFFDDPSQENYDRVIGGERPGFPDHMALWLKDLITKCWHGDECQRPTFSEIYDTLHNVSSSGKSWIDLRLLIELKMYENGNEGPPFRFEEEYLIPIMDIASQMAALHKRDICYKYLKAFNILVSGAFSKGAANFEGAYVQLRRDYDQIIIRDYDQIMIADYEGFVDPVDSALWRAPEILLATKNWLSARRNGNDPPPMSFSKAADVYSFGMVVYEISTGLLPFELEGFCNDPSEEDYDRVIDGERPGLPDHMAPWLKDLITRCWHGDEGQRPTFSEIYDTLSNVSSSGRGIR